MYISWFFNNINTGILEIKKDIKEKIKNAHYHKFNGVAPDGFILVPIEILEKLKDFDVWKEWKGNDNVLREMIIDYCNKL